MDTPINLSVLLESLDYEFDFEEGLEESPYCFFEVDSIYEKNRKIANREIFRSIIKGLRVMKNHAKNGFKNLSKEEQINLIIRRENQVVYVLRNGSFYMGKVDYYDTKIRKKVREIYNPFIKWSRKNKK